MGYSAISFRNKKSVVILVCNSAFEKQKEGGMNCTKRRRRKGRERRMGKELQTIFH